MKTTTDMQQGLDSSKWLDCHGDYLYRYALVRVREAVVAEDLLQETLLAAVGAHKGHAGRSAERTWLVGIMKHKDETECFEESGPWRGHWREERAPINWPIHALESREFWETFEHCLSQLPQQMSIAFTLREIDGLTSGEICEILNLTPNNLWVLLHRGRSKLRHLLEANWFSRRVAAAEISLETVSTTCDSGWVRSSAMTSSRGLKATHPPVIAGGTDRLHTDFRL